MRDEQRESDDGLHRTQRQAHDDRRPHHAPRRAAPMQATSSADRRAHRLMKISAAPRSAAVTYVKVAGMKLSGTSARSLTYAVVGANEPMPSVSKKLVTARGRSLPGSPQLPAPARCPSQGGEDDAPSNTGKRAAGRPPSELGHHVPNHGVILERVHRQVLAVSRAFRPAVPAFRSRA